MAGMQTPEAGLLPDHPDPSQESPEIWQAMVFEEVIDYTVPPTVLTLTSTHYNDPLGPFSVVFITAELVDLTPPHTAPVIGNIDATIRYGDDAESFTSNSQLVSYLNAVGNAQRPYILRYPVVIPSNTYVVVTANISVALTAPPGGLFHLCLHGRKALL